MKVKLKWLLEKRQNKEMCPVPPSRNHERGAKLPLGKWWFLILSEASTELKLINHFISKLQEN